MTVIAANLTGLAKMQLTNIQQPKNEKDLPAADWTFLFSTAANCRKAAVNLTRPSAVLVVDAVDLLVMANSTRITKPAQIVVKVRIYLFSAAAAASTDDCCRSH